jgi:biopolymer transport protein ExbD
MATTMSESDEVRAEINVTPLVDVVLVLLVILMLVAPMLKEDVPVELPIATHADEQTGSAIPVLTIAPDGGVALDGTPLPSDDLGTRLAAIYAARTDKTVMLAADRSLGYARVVEVMDACRAAGIERIGILTSPTPPGAPGG